MTFGLESATDLVFTSIQNSPWRHCGCSTTVLTGRALRTSFPPRGGWNIFDLTNRSVPPAESAMLQALSVQCLSILVLHFRHCKNAIPSGSGPHHAHCMTTFDEHSSIENKLCRGPRGDLDSFGSLVRLGFSAHKKIDFSTKSFTTSKNFTCQVLQPSHTCNVKIFCRTCLQSVWPPTRFGQNLFAISLATNKIWALFLPPKPRKLMSKRS